MEPENKQLCLEDKKTLTNWEASEVLFSAESRWWIMSGAVRVMVLR